MRPLYTVIVAHAMNISAFLAIPLLEQFANSYKDCYSNWSGKQISQQAFWLITKHNKLNIEVSVHKCSKTLADRIATVGDVVATCIELCLADVMPWYVRWLYHCCIRVVSFNTLMPIPSVKHHKQLAIQSSIATSAYSICNIIQCSS